ncbi:ferritin family protein [candidate division WOR-3 bacterium]|nr:ferritin family protein [candidate division WOR-3 bacterium]
MMKTINELLQEALRAEKKAKEFYTNAATKAQSEKGKEFFTQLAAFEQNHYDRVNIIIKAREEGKNAQPGAPQDIPMIKPEIEGQFEPNKDEIVDVINKAIKAEKDAQDQYRTIAGMMDGEEGKNIFTDLADEETKHQRILEDQFYHVSNKGTIIWGE